MTIKTNTILILVVANNHLPLCMRIRFPRLAHPPSPPNIHWTKGQRHEDLCPHVVLHRDQVQHQGIRFHVQTVGQTGTTHGHHGRSGSEERDLPWPRGGSVPYTWRFPNCFIQLLGCTWRKLGWLGWLGWTQFAT